MFLNGLSFDTLEPNQTIANWYWTCISLIYNTHFAILTKALNAKLIGHIIMSIYKKGCHVLTSAHVPQWLFRFHIKNLWHSLQNVRTQCQKSIPQMDFTTSKMNPTKRNFRHYIKVQWIMRQNHIHGAT